MAVKEVPPVSLFSPHHVSALPLCLCSPSPWCQTSFSPQLPSPSFDLPPFPWAARDEGKEQWRREGRAGEKGFPGQVGERMGSAVLRNRWRGQWGTGLGQIQAGRI